MRDDDLDFYVNLYLDYCRNVDDMSLDKKKTFLRRLLKKSESDEASSNCNSAADIIDSHFAEF